MFILANMWFQTLMRQFFFNVDKIVFGFISTIYDFLITIARTSVITQADIADMAGRVYKLLAIFMIFKVTFSLIMYVVNPDDFSDKEKGVSKLGTNIVISLALLILTPYIFSYAYQLQTIILEDNALAALIFGDKQQNATEAPFESAGDKMAYITMMPFFMPNPAIDELYECSQVTKQDGSGAIVFNSDCSGLNSNFESNNDDKSLFALTKDGDGNENTRFTQQTLKNYVAGVQLGNLDLMFRQDMAIATNPDNTEYIMNYKYVFSTVTGVLVVLLLLTFCLDVALRSIKLAFLQLVAPIPIISFVDPKSSKDGMFKKWVDMCFKTYLSLFIRLLALYFAVYIISRIDKMVDIINGSYVSNLLVKIFIIIGALMFAKQFPKILEGLGLKLDGGGFTLNPLRKIEKEALGGGILKKPNDMLAKAGKAVLKSPFTAASLGARKTIAGIDSAAQGKGFINGTKNVKSGIAQAKDKFMEKNMPNTYKAQQARKEGRENLKLRDQQKNIGGKYYNATDKKMDSDKLKEDLGKINSDYRASYEKTAKKKGDMFAAQAFADGQRNKIYNDALTDEDKKQIATKLGIDQAVVKNMSSEELIQNLNKYEGTAKKQYEVAQARHDEYKKMNPKAARIEDAYDYYEKMELWADDNTASSNSSSGTTSSSSSSSSGTTSSSSSSSSGTTSSSSGSSGGTTSSSSNSSSETTSSSSGSSGGITSSSYEATSTEMPAPPSGPSENIANEVQQNKDIKIKELSDAIESYKEALAKEEKRINDLVEESENYIKKLDKELYETTDYNRKDYLKQEISKQQERVENYKKQLKDYKDQINKQIRFFEEQKSILS